MNLKSTQKPKKEKKKNRLRDNPDLCIKRSIQAYLCAFLLFIISALLAIFPFISTILFYLCIVMILVGAFFAGIVNGNFSPDSFYIAVEPPTEEDLKELEELQRKLDERKRLREEQKKTLS